MQLRFGRILAGEIRNPGSYSILTLKTLGELDQNIATLFKKLCSACVVLGIQNNEHIIDARVPSLGGDAGSNALKKYGLGFDQLNILNEYDLIISDYNSWRDYNLCILPTKTIQSFYHSSTKENTGFYHPYQSEIISRSSGCRVLCCPMLDVNCFA